MGLREEILTPEDNYERTVERDDMEARACEGLKAVPEEIFEEMTDHLKAGCREITPGTCLSNSVSG